MGGHRVTVFNRGLLPDCSPFSGLWMSELDNRRSKEELELARSWQG